MALLLGMMMIGFNYYSRFFLKQMYQIDLEQWMLRREAADFGTNITDVREF
jgi:hypothetical protein